MHYGRDLPVSRAPGRVARKGDKNKDDISKKHLGTFCCSLEETKLHWLWGKQGYKLNDLLKDVGNVCKSLAPSNLPLKSNECHQIYPYVPRFGLFSSGFVGRLAG